MQTNNLSARGEFRKAEGELKMKQSLLAQLQDLIAHLHAESQARAERARNVQIPTNGASGDMAKAAADKFDLWGQATGYAECCQKLLDFTRQARTDEKNETIT